MTIMSKFLAVAALVVSGAVLAPLAPSLASAESHANTLSQAERARPVVTPGTGTGPYWPYGDPESIAEKHTRIMTAVIENTAALRRILGPRIKIVRGGEDGGYIILRTLLQLPSVSDDTKGLVREVLATPPVRLTPGCEALRSELLAQRPVMPRDPIIVLIEWLQNQLRNYLSKKASTCPVSPLAVDTAVAIVEHGRKTVYDPKWVAMHGGGPGNVDFEIPNWVYADAVGGLFGGVAGAAVASTISYYHL